MRRALAASLLLGIAAPAVAQDGQSATERARAFTLDLGDKPATEPTPEPRATPRPAREEVTRPTPAPRSTPAPRTTSVTRPAPVPPATTAAVSRPAPAVSPMASGALYTLDTPIGQLVADPRARAVLDRRLPGLSTDVNLDKFRSMGLRQFQPLTGGRLTGQMLDEVAGELAAIRPSTRRGVDR